MANSGEIGFVDGMKGLRALFFGETIFRGIGFEERKSDHNGFSGCSFGSLAMVAACRAVICSLRRPSGGVRV